MHPVPGGLRGERHGHDQLQRVLGWGIPVGDGAVRMPGVRGRHVQQRGCDELLVVRCGHGAGRQRMRLVRGGQVRRRRRRFVQRVRGGQVRRRDGRIELHGVRCWSIVQFDGVHGVRRLRGRQVPADDGPVELLCLRKWQVQQCRAKHFVFGLRCGSERQWNRIGSLRAVRAGSLCVVDGSFFLRGMQRRYLQPKIWCCGLHSVRFSDDHEGCRRRQLLGMYSRLLLGSSNHKGRPRLRIATHRSWQLHALPDRGGLQKYIDSILRARDHACEQRLLSLFHHREEGLPMRG